MVAERVDELDKLGNPTIAFQASGIDGIKVRIVAKCDDEATAKRVLDSEEALLRGLLGDLIFGIDEQSMETVVLELLRKRAHDGGRHRDADRRHPVGAHERARSGDGDVSRRQSCVPKLSAAGSPSRPRPSSAPAPLPRRRASASAPTSASPAITPEASEDQAPGAVFLGRGDRDAQHLETMVLPPDRKRMREFGVIGLLNLLRKKLSA